MRIENGNNISKVAQKAEDTQHASGEEIVRRVQSQLDIFQSDTRASQIDELLEGFTLSNDTAPPEIIGKANEPKISDEALERLREQVQAAQNKSTKKG